MSKKLLSVVLALALALSCFAVSAFALGDIGYESEEDAANYTQTWALDEPVDNGDGTYTVNVRLTANYVVGPIQFKVIKTVTAGTLTLTGATDEGTVIPENWLADVSYNDTTGEVAIIPHPDEDAISGIDNPSNAIVAVLTYTASSDAAATLKLSIVDNVKSKTNPGGTLLAARMSDGNVVTGTAIVGQTVTNTTEPEVTIGDSATTPPTLAVVDGTIGVIDTSRTELDADDIDGDGDTQVVDGYLLGFDQDVNSSVDELFYVEGDGEMVIVPSEAGSETGTGAIVQVVDLAGNVVAKYVLILFGDANGDGDAELTDAAMTEENYSYLVQPYDVLFTYQAFACDLNADGEAELTDAAMIEEHYSYILAETDRISPAAIIAELGL